MLAALTTMPDTVTGDDMATSDDSVRMSPEHPIDDYLDKQRLRETQETHRKHYSRSGWSTPTHSSRDSVEHQEDVQPELSTKQRVRADELDESEGLSDPPSVPLPSQLPFPLGIG